MTGGGPTVTFTYDGDGNRVKKDEGGVVTHYPGRHYEATIGSGSTKYYHADGQLIAFERSSEYDPEPWGTRYVFRDHLGSTNVVVNGRGLILWEDRFLPFGDVRYTYRKDDDSSFPVQTQYRYTSQWFEDGVGASAENGLDRGLYFYGARWYDSSVGRFLQPDTIVPNPGDPQDLNRYTYSRNNPTRYSDPTGRAYEESGGIASCWTPGTVGCGSSTPEAEQWGNSVLGNTSAMIPGLETGDDILTLTTGCGYACQLGAEDPVDWRWRAFSGVMLFAPVGGATVREPLQWAIKKYGDDIPQWIKHLMRGIRTERRVLDALGYTK